MSAPAPRKLGFSVAAAIVIANMIGVGVFTSAGFQAKALHDPGTMLVAWVLGGVLALCGAATYAELGARMPKVGGEYVYLREAYHPAVGFMSGWVSMTAGFSAPIAVAALAFASYLGKLWPALDGAGAHQAVAIGLVLAMTILHTIDTVIGGKVQAVFTAAKVILIAGFILAGFTLGTGDWSHFASRGGGLENVGTTAFAISLMYVTFAYSGWNAAAYIAGEIDDPERNLPRALLVGTGVVMVLYLLLNVVFIYAVSPATLAGPVDGFAPIVEVGDAAARSLFGSSTGRLVSALVSLALISAVSAMVMAGPRVYAAMAADRALPKVLAYRNARGVPIVAVITQGALGVAFVMIGDLGVLIRYVGFTLAIFAALTVGSVFIFRWRDHRDGPPATVSQAVRRRSYRTIGYPFSPIAFVGLSLWIAYAQMKDNPKESAVGAGVLVVGALLYAFLRPRPTPPQ